MGAQRRRDCSDPVRMMGFRGHFVKTVELCDHRHDGGAGRRRGDRHGELMSAVDTHMAAQFLGHHRYVADAKKVLVDEGMVALGPVLHTLARDGPWINVKYMITRPARHHENAGAHGT